MECPECGSEQLVKKGFRKDKQRYQCKKCGRYFTEGTHFVGRQPKLPKPEVTCPHCNSDKIIRDGMLPNGKQRYKCLDCRKSFSNTLILKPVEWRCPFCDSKLRRAGKSKTGLNAYYCNTCGKTCYGDPPKLTRRFKQENTTVKCPYCKSMNLVKHGKSNGVNKYKCNDCKHTFTDNTEQRLKYIAEQERSKEVCPRCGGTRIINCGKTSVGNKRYRCLVCRRTYTKNTQLVDTVMRKPPIQDKDKNAILMYKLQFNVSDEQICESFNCSRYALKQLLKQHRKVKLTDKQINKINKYFEKAR